MDENDNPCANTLTVWIETDEFSQSDILAVRKACNDLVAGGLLVQHCSIESGEWHVALQFTTDAPEPLWTIIRDKMFHHAELGERISANTSVVWHGEDWFDYHIWVYRVATPIPNQFDGFENRIQCSACDKYFWFGHSKEENCCPYCDQPIVVRSSRDDT